MVKMQQSRNAAKAEHLGYVRNGERIVFVYEKKVLRGQPNLRSENPLQFRGAIPGSRLPIQAQRPASDHFCALSTLPQSHQTIGTSSNVT
jgi:hypothetical protein